MIFFEEFLRKRVFETFDLLICMALSRVHFRVRGETLPTGAFAGGPSTTARSRMPLSHWSGRLQRSMPNSGRNNWTQPSRWSQRPASAGLEQLQRQTFRRLRVAGRWQLGHHFRAPLRIFGQDARGIARSLAEVVEPPPSGYAARPMEKVPTTPDPLDPVRLRVALRRARRVRSGDALALGAMMAAQCVNSLHGANPSFTVTWGAAAWGASLATLLTVAVTMMAPANRIDDAFAAGPQSAFVAHCRATLTGVVESPEFVMMPLWFIGCALLPFLVGLNLDASKNSPPDYWKAAADVTFYGTLCVRPVWNRFVGTRDLRAVLATLPAPPRPEPPGPALEAELRELLASGNRIEAIKRCRESTGAGLAEAVAAVKALERE